MSEIGRLKFKSGVLVFIAKFIKKFNRNLAGVSAKYNLRYAKGYGRQHTLDVMRKGGLKGLPCVLYMHGGGWAAFDKSVFRSTAKRFADCGALVFNCNFRLAPKYNIDDMLEDAACIVEFIKANVESYGGDANRIIFAGDSAGAHILSLLLNRAIRDNNQDIVSRVKGCAFFYGVYDLDTARYSGFKLMNTYLNAFVPPKTADYEKVLYDLSPVHLVNAKHPRTLICCGEIDALTESQSKVYARVLEENGVPVRAVIFPAECKDAEHRFITYDTNPASVKAFAEFKEFIKEI